MLSKRTGLSLAILLGLGAVIPAANATIIVSEVNARGNNRAYGDDWIEITNTGTSAVDLSQLKIDDNSGLPANAGLIQGLGLLNPGQSAVVMLEVNAADFAAQRLQFLDYWFASTSGPAGFLLGFVDGTGLTTGLGLGNSGDAINIWNLSNQLQASVSFGTAGDPATFDNAAGANGTGVNGANGGSISTLSIIGTNGAFLALNGIEIGSPGAVSAVPLPAGVWLLLSGLGALGAASRRKAAARAALA
jgi:hypothetical protein